MKRFVLFVFVVLCIGSFLSGCGIAHSQREYARRFKVVDDIRARQFVDDCAYAALYDRPSYLTEWPVRDTD